MRRVNPNGVNFTRNEYICELKKRVLMVQFVQNVRFFLFATLQIRKYNPMFYIKLEGLSTVIAVKLY